MPAKKDRQRLTELHSAWRRLDEIGGGDHSLDIIMDAARRHKLEFLLLAAREIGINYTENGKTALFWLAGEEDLEAVMLLIEAGAKIDAAAKGAASPLMHAAFRNRLGMVQLLIQHGAKVDYRDANGDSALSFAEEHGHHEIVDCLKKQS
jgi:ankyrin repeat protein